MGSEWKEVIFSDVIEINPNRELSKGQEYPFIDMQSVEPYTRKVSNVKFRKYNGSGSKFKNGDTLFARITPCLENGKIAYVKELKSGEKGFGSTEFLVFSGKEGVTDNLFVYYLSRSQGIREYAVKNMIGTSGRQRVDKSCFNELRIKLPPLPEQQKIAFILSAFDDKIELNNEMNKTLEEIAQAIFKHWFIDFEFPNENGEPYKSSGGEFVDSELGPIPKGWKVKALDEIADFLNGLAMQKYRPKDESNYLPVLKIRELKQGITLPDSDKCSVDIDPRYIVDDGDVIFSWSGSLEVKIWCGGKAGLNQHLFKVSSNKYPKWFYYYWIKHHLNDFRRIAEDKATTMGHIKREHLNQAKVIVPDDEQLKQFDRVLSPLIEFYITNGKEVKTLSQLRDTLLPKLISGEIRVM